MPAVEVTECRNCVLPFSSELRPQALEACGHTLCEKCNIEFGTMNVRTGDVHYKCLCCRDVSTGRGYDPTIPNLELELFLKTKVPARCFECLERFDADRPPHFFGARGGKKHQCWHSCCGPCYESMWQSRRLFCRICVIQLPVPEDDRVPPKNFALIEAMESALGQIQPEDKAKWDMKENEQDESDFEDKLAFLSTQAMWFAMCYTTTPANIAFIEMIQKIEELNDNNQITLKDKKTMLWAWKKSDRVTDEIVGYDFAEDLIYFQARIEEHMEIKTVEGVNGWNRVPWNVYYTPRNNSIEE